MLGGTENLGGGAAFDDLARVQNGDAMAESRDREQIVRDIEDAHAKFAVEASEETGDFGMGDGVERAGGFIRDAESGTGEEGHGSADTLGLAGAQMRGVAVANDVVIGGARASGCR